MKYLLLISLFVSTTTAFAVSQDVLEETIYYSFQKDILSPKTFKRLNGFTSFEQKLYVDALWNLADEGYPEAIKELSETEDLHFALIEKLRLGILRLKYGNALNLSNELLEEVENNLRGTTPELRVIYTLAAYENELLSSGHSSLVSLAKTHNSYFDLGQDQEARKELSDDMIADLFYRTPDTTTYMNGEYVKSVKIYMFCRENRIFPCLMVMRDVHGEIVKNADGTIWNHPSLASSARGLPSYTTNGNTPEGVWTIDSVMPSADQQVSYGKFRRMIINFIPKSSQETLLKSLIPASSQDKDWWKPSTVARDIGRNLFRIHGTGKKNTDAMTPYYPFMRTSGCIAQRENTYDGVEYKDQRELLDAIMTAMDLKPVYENELKVKGFLFVVELDDKDEPVTMEDLNAKGIE